ncbi:fec operon regulator FecR [compost metagenome]
MVTLPDGSKIRLNAASTLKFPSTFNKLNTRTVELRGEAYFDVTHNPSQPFIIKSGNQEIKVLGTHFNLNTYDGNSMKTTLISGSVQVSLLQEPDQKRVLKPGEQAIANNRSLEIVKIDTAIAVGWKNNEFIFKDEKFETVLNRLSSWYDVDFEYTGKKPDFRITGFMGRKEKLSKVLATIASNGKVKFKIEGRVVHVMN